MHRWARVQQLSAREVCLLIRAAVLLPLIRLGLSVLGYRGLHHILERLIPVRLGECRLDESEITKSARWQARVVSIAANRRLLRANCLQRSLLLWSLLRAQGVDSTIQFGARANLGHLEAHAWVERGGIILNDSEDARLRYPPLRDAAASAPYDL